MAHRVDQDQRPTEPPRARKDARGENFPVAVRLLPPTHRRHLLAVYAFARHVDDIGDEAPGDRLGLLDEVSADLDRLFSGAVPAHPVIRDLAATVHARDLPRRPFDLLVAANTQDQFVRRYETFDQLAGYCMLSAAPVGQLVLGIFGVDRPEFAAPSDAVCIALQLLEHCQDVAEDVRAGRVYLPARDLEAFGVEPDDLRAPAADRRVRALVGYEVQRAVGFLDSGAELVSSLRGFARVAVAAYVAGGLATAAALAEARFDVLSAVPRPSRTRTTTEWLGLLAAAGAR